MSTIKYYYIRTSPSVSKKAEVTYTTGKRIETRDIQPRGAPIACVAYQRRRDDDMSPPVVDGETPEQTRAKSWDLVCYALSACNSKHDEFHKEDGRGMAESRLTVRLDTKNPMDQAYCFNIESTASANEVLEMILDEIAGHGFVPSHVTKACKDWLDK